MSRARIKEGDIVHVDFNCARHTLCHRAEVLHIPAATGESWIFCDLDTEQTHYVSEGCTISLLEGRTEPDFVCRRNEADK